MDTIANEVKNEVYEIIKDKGATFYGAFVEFGHRVGSRKLGDARKEVAGQHFMQKAVAAKGQAAADAAAAKMQQELVAIARQ